MTQKLCSDARQLSLLELFQSNRRTNKTRSREGNQKCGDVGKGSNRHEKQNAECWKLGKHETDQVRRESTSTGSMSIYCIYI